MVPALTYTYDVYVNGAPYATGVTTPNWDNGPTSVTAANMYLYRPIKAGDVITVEHFTVTNLAAQRFSLKIEDEQGNDLSSQLVKPTAMDVLGSGETKNIQFKATCLEWW